MYEEIGDEEHFTIEAIKQRRLEQEYRDFLKAVKSNKQLYRTQISGYKKYK